MLSEARPDQTSRKVSRGIGSRGELAGQGPPSTGNTRDTGDQAGLTAPSGRIPGLGKIGRSKGGTSQTWRGKDKALMWSH